MVGCFPVRINSFENNSVKYLISSTGLEYESNCVIPYPFIASSTTIFRLNTAARYKSVCVQLLLLAMHPFSILLYSIILRDVIRFN